MATDVTEKIIVATPSRAGRVVAAPFQLRILADDTLRIKWYFAALSGDLALLRFTWRILTDDGEIITTREQSLGLAIRTIHTRDFPLRDGFLLSLAIRVSNTDVQQGAMWAQAYIAIGGGTEDVMMTPLVQGFPSLQQVLAFPGSPFDTTASLPGNDFVNRVASFPAGTEVVIAVPNGVRWSLVAVCATLSTSGVGPARQVAFSIFDAIGGVQPVYRNRAPFTQAPGTDQRYTWAVGTPNAGSVHNDTFVDAIPPDIRQSSLETWGTETINLQAGDQWTLLTYHVKEYIDLV
jgi:hypothetical protein